MVTNKCDFSAYVAVCWHDPQNDNWPCGCWITVDENESKYLKDDENDYVTTDLDYVYFYAEDPILNIVWDGEGDAYSDYGNCEGYEYFFFLIAI